jgi:putative DNA primase/helicase
MSTIGEVTLPKTEHGNDPNDNRDNPDYMDSIEPAGFGDWPVPQPLLAKIEPQPYPLDALPDLVRYAVEEVLGFVKAPAPLVANSALAALSLAIQAYSDIERAKKLSGPTGLFLLTIADSGERKSTCDAFFMKAIQDYDASQVMKMQPELRDYAAKVTVWNAKYEGLRSKIKEMAKKGADSQEQEEALRDLEDDKPEEPRIPKLFYADTTPEALKWSLGKKWPSGGIISSEAGLVLGSHGMNQESIMRNLATLNQLWDGATIATDRRTSESFVVQGARLTIALQVQEAPFRSFVDHSDGLARGTGFLPRFLVSWPESTQGSRPFSEPPDEWTALTGFNQRIAEVLNQPTPIGKDGALTPQMLNFTQEAKAAWISFHDTIETELCSGGDLFEIRDVASKIADNAARIATLFQIFEQRTSNSVGLEAFESASRVAAWHLHEARRFFGELALPKEQASAVKLDKWLVDYCAREKINTVSRRDVQRNITPTHLRKGPNLDAALIELMEADRIRVYLDGKRKHILLNPMLLEESV